MGAFRILLTNSWPESTLSASSEVAALPAEASAHPDRIYVWRSLTETADQQITSDIGTDISPTMIAVANLRKMNSGAVKLQQAGSAATPGAWVDVVTLSDPDVVANVTVGFFAATTARHWRLYYTNGTPLVADYAEAGYIGLGAYFEPSSNIRGGFDMPAYDPSIITQSVDGQQTATARSQYTSLDLRLNLVSAADMTQFTEFYRSLTVRSLIFLMMDASLDWSWLLGRFRSPLTRTPLDGGSFAMSVGFEESR